MGCSYLCKILTMVLASLLLNFTTPIDDFLQLSRVLRIPYKIGFIMTTAVRFIPTMENKAQMALDAQRSRGADLDAGGIIKRFRSYSSVMIPLIVDSIRMSENLALAMINRGFGGSPAYTFLHEIKMARKDYLLVLTALVFLVFSIVLKLDHYGQL